MDNIFDRLYCTDSNVSIKYAELTHEIQHLMFINNLEAINTNVYLSRGLRISLLSLYKARPSPQIFEIYEEISSGLERVHLCTSLIANIIEEFVFPYCSERFKLQNDLLMKMFMKGLKNFCREYCKATKIQNRIISEVHALNIHKRKRQVESGDPVLIMFFKDLIQKMATFITTPPKLDTDERAEKIFEDCVGQFDLEALNFGSISSNVSISSEPEESPREYHINHEKHQTSDFDDLGHESLEEENNKWKESVEIYTRQVRSKSLDVSKNSKAEIIFKQGPFSPHSLLQSECEMKKSKDADEEKNANLENEIVKNKKNVYELEETIKNFDTFSIPPEQDFSPVDEVNDPTAINQFDLNLFIPQNLKINSNNDFHSNLYDKLDTSLIESLPHDGTTLSIPTPKSNFANEIQSFGSYFNFSTENINKESKTLNDNTKLETNNDENMTLTSVPLKSSSRRKRKPDKFDLQRAIDGNE